MKKRFSEVQIIGFLREAEAGVEVKIYVDAMDSPKPGRARRQAAEGPGTGEYPAEDVTGRGAVGVGLPKRCFEKKVRAPARRRWCAGCVAEG